MAGAEHGQHSTPQKRVRGIAQGGASISLLHPPPAYFASWPSHPDGVQVPIHPKPSGQEDGGVVSGSPSHPHYCKSGPLHSKKPLVPPETDRTETQCPSHSGRRCQSPPNVGPSAVCQVFPSAPSREDSRSRCPPGPNVITWELPFRGCGLGHAGNNYKVFYTL